MNPASAPDHFRLFVAISVPESIKAQLAQVQQTLKESVPKCSLRWTPASQMHLTLRFLGNVASSRVGELVGSLRQACGNFAPLQLRAESIGFFPAPRAPRVVWAGVHDAANQLPQVQRAVEQATDAFTTEAPEKKFTGHLTLARIKFIRRPEAEALAKAATAIGDRCFGEWTAKTVELIRSELSPTGARYTTLAEAALAPG